MSDPSFLAGMVPNAADLQDLGRLGTWTPSLTAVTTNPNLGSGATITGNLHRNGRFIWHTFDLSFGTSGTSAGSGQYRIEGMTFDVDTSSTPTGAVVGFMQLNNSGTNFYAFIKVATSTQLTMNTSGDYAAVTAAAPFAPGASDFLRGSFGYFAVIP